MTVCFVAALLAVQADLSYFLKVQEPKVPTNAVWRAPCTPDGITWEMRGGATGSVSAGPDGIRIEKTNAEGAIIVRAPEFAAEKGATFTFMADVSASGTIWEYSFGMLRVNGLSESFKPSPLDRKDSQQGGPSIMWALPNTAPGRSYRKYEQHESTDGVVRPMIVIGGEPSTSVWRNWCAQRRDDWIAAWNNRPRRFDPPYREKMMDDAEFTEKLAADVEHTARVERRDGVSRLVVDGQVVPSYVYRGKHGEPTQRQDKLFFGGELQKVGVNLMIVDVRLGPTGNDYGYWTKDGFDVKSAVRDVRDAMRIGHDSLFLIAPNVTIYPEFTIEHPEERWIKADGKPAMGNGSTCTGYVDHTLVNTNERWAWPSFASRKWRDAVSKCLIDLVAALRAEGLTKRIVGAHLWGYFDGQCTIPFADYSAPAKAEYARYLAEPDNVATNYDFFCRQLAHRALEEFARVFKREMGKDVIAVRWSESVLRGRDTSSWDIGAFCRSDALDVMVAQPWYAHRLPGLIGASRPPFSSLHLHGKLFWDELDFRTYVADGRGLRSFATFTGVGGSPDLPTWHEVLRKHTGVAAAMRMGDWFYEKCDGCYAAPEVARDVGAERKVLAALSQGTPSPWKPSVAVVVDEAGAHGWSDEPCADYHRLEYDYFDQLPYLAVAGVPFDIYLAEDALRHPELLDDYKMAVFAQFRKVDAPRKALFDRFAAQGRTAIFTALTGELGGAKATGFDIVDLPEPTDVRVVPEAGVTGLVNGLSYLEVFPYSAGYRPVLKPRRTVRETKDVVVLARYAADRRPALVQRTDKKGRHIYVSEPGGITPTLFSRFAAEAKAYSALPPGAAMVTMNGDFVAIHALQNGEFRFRLPFDCRVVDIDAEKDVVTENGEIPLTLVAGKNVRFRLLPKNTSLLAKYVSEFNAGDNEHYANDFPNAAAERFLAANIPLFECPDREVERAYYFRWWTFRKHLRHDTGTWTVSEFLPNVSWAKKGNTIVCPAGHHFREGRWLRDPKFMTDYARFWLTDPEVKHRCAYCTWLFTSVCDLAAVTGQDELPKELLDAAVANYREWETGRIVKDWSRNRQEFQFGGDGKGAFLSVDDREGSEFSLGGNGYRPLLNSAMWSEAHHIARVARHVGRTALADEFEAKAAKVLEGIYAHCWNPDIGFVTTGLADGTRGTVRELNGYAPWYFGVPMGDRRADWAQLSDPQGFAARFGLSFPERRAPGFVLSYEGHACQWNGPSWPYATSIALTGLANDLHRAEKPAAADVARFAAALRQYAAAHRLVRPDGRVVPWIDENMNPDTGDWIARTMKLAESKTSGRDFFERGKDYNHSTFCDLVISGLVGVCPKSDGSLDVKPLIPADWNWFRLSNLRYRGKDYTITYDRDGTHFGKGKGIRYE